MKFFKNIPDPGKINLKNRNRELRNMILQLFQRLREQDRELAALREELVQLRERDKTILENAQKAIEKIEVFNSNLRKD